MEEVLHDQREDEDSNRHRYRSFERLGLLTANALASSGHNVYASMRVTSGHDAQQVAEMLRFAKDESLELRPIELDVLSQESVDNEIANIMWEQGRIDVVIHNAEHVIFGPAEAFTPGELAELYDINVLSTQRVNRAVLPAAPPREQ